MEEFAIFKIVNKISGKFFIGKSSFKGKADIKKIYPRGKKIIKDIKDLGWNNFEKEIMFTFDSKDKMRKKFKEIVNKNFIKNSLTYNEDSFGKIVVKTEKGNKKISTSDPDYINGKYETTSKNKLAVKDEKGNILYVDKSDEIYKQGKVKPISYGKVTVKDNNGNTFQVNKNDPKYIDKTYKFISTDTKYSTKSKEKIKEKQNIRRLKEKHIKYPNFPYDINCNEGEFYLIKDLCNHSIKIKPRHFNKLYKLNYKDNRIYCPMCVNKVIDEYNPTEEQIKQHQQEYNILWKKNYIIHSSFEYLHMFYPYILKSILVFNITNIPWEGKIFKFRKNIKFNKCKYSNCDNETSYSKSNKRFNKFCKTHNKITSNYENEIQYFLNNYIKDYKINFRDLGKELDIYIPDKKLAIEFNGIYWHSDEFKEKNYHYMKWKMCKDNGIKLITIWEDDWNSKQDIVKSVILNNLNIIQNKIYARKCKIKSLISSEVRDFLNINHIQGNVSSSINLGLYHSNQLVLIMTFEKKRKITGQKSINSEYEMIRFCSKLNTNVVGGASKLFKYFIDNYNPNRVISYANCDISNDNLYKALKFKEIGHTGLNYWWVKDDIKYHRNIFMKHKLIKEGADPNKTENDIMKEKGFHKIYGNGNIKFEYINKN